MRGLCGKEQLHFSVKHTEIHKLVYTPNVNIINLDLDGKSVKTVIQEVQHHPVTDTPLLLSSFYFCPFFSFFHRILFRVLLIKVYKVMLGLITKCYNYKNIKHIFLLYIICLI